MSEFSEKSLVLLGLFASVALGVAVGSKGTWLTVAVLTLFWEVVTVVQSRMEDRVSSVVPLWWDFLYVYTSITTVIAWIVAVVVAPLARLFMNGSLRIGLDQFVR